MYAHPFPDVRAAKRAKEDLNFEVGARDHPGQPDKSFFPNFFFLWFRGHTGPSLCGQGITSKVIEKLGSADPVRDFNAMLER